MALVIPEDVVCTPFSRNGFLFIDGEAFQEDTKISTTELLNEINSVINSMKQNSLQTRGDWQGVRNVFCYWCFSRRTEADNNAINAFFRHVGLFKISVPDHSPSQVFSVIENNHNLSPFQSPSFATAAPRGRATHRLPFRMSPADSNGSPSPAAPHDTIQLGTTIPPTATAYQAASPEVPVNLNTNPRFQGVYNFTDHRQEYEGFQFQCIFRCLRDGKHCRKAPVREMNRHLRDRHNFRQGFKIAGVDWENKRWRGAGAGHEECVGRMVVKDTGDDDTDDEARGYVVR